MRLLLSVALVAVLGICCGCGGPHGSAGSISEVDPPSAQTSTIPFVYVSNSGASSVSGFAIDVNTGTLTEVTGSPFPTPTPAGLARDGSGKYLTVANGTLTRGFPGLSVIGVDPKTGALSDLHCIDKEFPGNSPCYPLVPNTQGTPRFVAAAGETIYIGNVGSNDVSVFLQDPNNGDLGTSIPSEFSSSTIGLTFLDFVRGKLWSAGDSGIVELNATPGKIGLSLSFVLDNSIGYRAAAIDSSDKFLYAIDENDFIHDFCLDPLCAIGDDNPAPPVASPGGASSMAVLGNFAYVTHVNSGDISIYSIDPGSCTGNECTNRGILTISATVPARAGATSARIFLNRFLYVANAGDGTVSGYSIDSKTGLLRPVPGSPFKTGTSPMYIAAQ